MCSAGFCPALSDTMTGESPTIRAELAVAAIALVSTGAVASAQAQTQTASAELTI